VLRGDIVVELDGEPITGVADLQRLMTTERISREVSLTVLRAQGAKILEITPTEL
jgi:S1-C subfamily serine protease